MPRPTAKADTCPSDPPATLAVYQAKRDFTATPEPQGTALGSCTHRFVVQKHAARRLHYDLRLELDGVLKSWAVTRGPSLVPGEKRLAVHTEDHPIDYLSFEGVIPKGEYGGGTMIVWDWGEWSPLGDPRRGYAKGHLDFELKGQRLNGRWHLVRMRPKPRETKEQWLLLKGDDAFARSASDPEITAEFGTSVLSGRTNEDLARVGAVRADHTARVKATAGRSSLPDLARLPGARKAILPAFVAPSLASLTDKPPGGPDWIHEIKFDGYRLQARIDGANVQLLTRKGLDWTDKFTSIAEALGRLKLGSALLDGELVVEDEAGISNFARLQADLKARRTDRMVFYAFDLLYLQGRDLRAVPLAERKLILAGLLDDAPAGGPIRLSEHLDQDGEAMLRHACRLGLEGIVSKRVDLPYRSGRGTHWLKAKCTARQEFVVAGYVPSTASRKAIGSLVLGLYEDGELVHAGRVGTGFSAALAESLWTELERIRTPGPPFSRKLAPEAARGVRWVEPRLVAEVALRGWTADGLVRQAAFRGIRDDKEPREVVREGRARADPRSGPKPIVGLTHPDRVLWPDIGLTKQGLAEFYAEIADWVLPHVAGRPLSFVRCPSGVGKDCFFQKHGWEGMSLAVKRREIGGDKVLFIEDLDGLIALVQASVLEIHPWGSRVEEPEQPDRMTIDLDPGEDVSWTSVIEAALGIRDRLCELGLTSFVKTTGGKGLHVVVPLAPKLGWDEVKNWSRDFCERLAKAHPERFTANMAKRARGGRIYLDYLRNGRRATAVTAYSPRARPGAPVSTPLAWEELSPTLRPSHFTVENLPTRLRHLASDPWAEMAKLTQSLPHIAVLQGWDGRSPSGRAKGTRYSRFPP